MHVEISNERWAKAKRAPRGYAPRRPPSPPPPPPPPPPPRKMEVPGYVPPWERPPTDRRARGTLPERLAAARALLCLDKHAHNLAYSLDHSLETVHLEHELHAALDTRTAAVTRSELLQPSVKVT